MGWKAECIFVNENGPGYLGTLPNHDWRLARAYLESLFPNRPLPPGMLSNLLDELTPPAGFMAVGAYPGACVISDWQDLIGCATPNNNATLRQLLQLFPAAEVIALELESVTTSFAYAVYDKGNLRRAYGGEARAGITIDIGEPLPEELPFFNEAQVQNGGRVFFQRLGGQVFEFDAVGIGESMAMAVTSRVFGKPLDRFPAERLQVERIRHPAA